MIAAEEDGWRLCWFKEDGWSLQRRTSSVEEVPRVGSGAVVVYTPCVMETEEHIVGVTHVMHGRSRLIRRVPEGGWGGGLVDRRMLQQGCT